MLLKKVIIKGFKSFADKIEVDVPGGITVFVGPNGCGKSNVSDAIRWVMGEQNPRNLRGMRMQDMIFAGAESRKAESMSEVSLIFDNPDGFFDVPNAEVMITRRLYRSGESEYLLNKTAVRLKDIQELFMDTGMGHHSYTLIEQGRVEHMLSAKPADRLAIFEEAAGVTKYKSRRDETLRKLYRAEQDLLRLTDIEEELGKQSRSLRRQAQQAARYKRLLGELEQIEEVVAVREALRLQKEKAGLEQAKNELETQLTGEKTQLTALETRLQDLSLQIDGFTAKLREQHSNYHDVQLEIQKRESQLTFLKESETELSERKRQLTTEIERGRVRMTELADAIEEKEKAIQTLQSEVGTREGEYSQRIEHLQHLRSQRKDLTKNLEEVRNALWDLERQILSCKNEIQQIDQQAEFLRTQQESALNEKQDLEHQLEIVEDSFRSISAEFISQQQQFETNKNSFDNLQGEIADKNSQIQEQSQRLRQEEKALDKLRVRLQLLEQMDKKFEGYQDSAKFVLKRKAENVAPYSYVSSPLADLLKVKKGYEKAVEAALSARLECLLVDKVDEAKEILESLGNNDSGRVLLQCRELLKDESLEASPKPTVSWKPLQTMVTVADDYKVLVQVLLGTTGFAETLEEALSIMKGEDAPECMVTIRGEVISRDGLMAGGRPVAHGVLARKREQEEIGRRIVAVEAIVEQLSNVLEQLQRERDALSSERESLREKQENLRADLRAMEQDIKSAERERNRLNNAFATIEKENERRANLSDKHSGRRNELQEKEKGLREKEQALRSELAHLEQRLNQHQSNLETQESEHQQAEMARLSAKKDLERFRGELEDVKRRSKSLETRLEQAKNEIESIASRMDKAVSSRTELNKEVAVYLNKADAIQKTISESDSSLQNVISTREECAKQTRKLNEDHEAQTSKRNELEKSILRIDLEYQNLHDRMIQEFKKELDEIIEAAPEDERPTEALKEEIGEIRRKVGQLGEVNALAIKEYEEITERLTFMQEQRKDLESARASLMRTIETLQKTASEKFHEALEQIRDNFRMVFRKMFRGGKADLVFIDLENNKDGGIEIVVQPPGKHLQNITLLSGGEKALSAIALLFAMYLTKPSPFCLFDEVDAPLDEHNVGNFCRMIQEFSEKSQFLVITHNKRTMEMASTIYGITMENKGVSKIISLQLENQDEETEAPVSAAD